MGETFGYFILIIDGFVCISWVVFLCWNVCLVLILTLFCVGVISIVLSYNNT